MNDTSGERSALGEQNRLSTGISGFDEVMSGGLLPGHSYLLRGGPGTGKTTFGLHFLTEAARRKEPALFISMEESEDQIRTTASRLGFDVSRVDFLDLSPTSAFFVESQSYDIFSSAEVEREPVTGSIVEKVRKTNPKRVFIDPLTQLRYLSTDRFQFHRQTLSFLRFLADGGATVLISSEYSPDAPDYDIQFLAHTVIDLKTEDDSRTLSVIKFRNSDFITGAHSYRLTAKGVVVYPRLNPVEYSRNFEKTVLKTGIDEMDMLLYGGIEGGTVNMISGPSGAGKTTLGMQILYACAERGEKAVAFSFDEETAMIAARCEAIGMRIREMTEKGLLQLQKIEPLIYSPDQFALIVRDMVEAGDVRTVLLDSTSGYNLAMKGEKLVDHLHVLCKYLQNMGVTVILVTELTNITGDFIITENGISYLADNVVFLRYLEINGEMKKAIGVLKKRLSDFEKTLREFSITEDGIMLGKPLTNLRGILRGEPDWIKNA